MGTFAQRPGLERTARMGMVALSIAILSAVGLAACGNGSTSPPPAAGGSVEPDGSQTPVTSTPAATATPTPAATATPTPGASPTPGATSPTPAPSGAAGSFDACALLVAADVSRILGGPVQAKPMPSGGWIASQCAENGPTSGFFLSVGTAASIAAFGDPAAADAKAKLAQFKSGPGAPKDVAGIGNGAAVSSVGIAAYIGGTYLEITNLGLTEDQLIEIVKLAVATVQ